MIVTIVPVVAGVLGIVMLTSSQPTVKAVGGYIADLWVAPKALIAVERA